VAALEPLVQARTRHAGGATGADEATVPPIGFAPPSLALLKLPNAVRPSAYCAQRQQSHGLFLP
jgi:hypothetical protein